MTVMLLKHVTAITSVIKWCNINYGVINIKVGITL